jgi:hypothetical protein
MQGAKAVSGMQQIVGLAQQTDIPSVGRTQSGKGFDVVKLEKRPRTAAAAVRRDKRALTTVSTVGFSPHHDGQVASTFSGL